MIYKVRDTDMKTREIHRKNRRTRAAPAIKTSLDQWVALAALVEHGSYEAAAEALDRSQSAVSYQISRLQQSLRCRLLEIRGRRAVLTVQGEALLERARGLLEEWRSLESFAQALKQGNEPILRIVADKAFPRARLLRVLGGLKIRCPSTQVELSDAVLSGAEEAIADGTADVVVTAHIPSGVLGDFLCETAFVAVPSPSQPLHVLGRPISQRDLERHQQVVLRDSGTRTPRSEGYLGAKLRWTVAGFDTSTAIVEAGLAYAWLPNDLIRTRLAAGSLKLLPLEAGARRTVRLYVVLVRASQAGPVARIAVQLFRQFAVGDIAQ
jgi:DNA-binding transcriptional LysR family regulator